MKKLQLPKKWKGNESTEEEILSMVNEGQEQGVILDSEAKMISRIMEFGDKEAQDVMTNRNNIHAFDANITLKEALTQADEKLYEVKKFRKKDVAKK